MRALCAGACVPSGFVWVITPTFMHGLFDIVVVLEEEKCHLKHFLGRLKVKVTLEGHINELFLAITLIYIYMHEFQNNFAQVFSLKSRSAI